MLREGHAGRYMFNAPRILTREHIASHGGDIRIILIGIRSRRSGIPAKLDPRLEPSFMLTLAVFLNLKLKCFLGTTAALSRLIVHLE